MNSVKKTLKQTGKVVLTLAALSAAHDALAVGTASGTSVTNRATISYDVAGVTQQAIESSPTGNSTPGAGPTSVSRTNRPMSPRLLLGG